MAVPGSVQSRYTNAFASTFDVLMPEKLPQAFARYGDQGANAFLWLKAMSRKRMVSANTYYHYEDDLKNPTFHSLNAPAAPGAGNPQVITLIPADLNSLNQFYPQKGDIIFYKGGQQGIIYSVDVTTPTAPILTVYPVQAGASYALPAVAANEELSVISGASSEGAGQPNAIATGYTQFSNSTQIVKSTVSETGTGLTDQTWLTINGIANAPLYTRAFMDMEYRQALKISSALMFGKGGDGSVIDTETGLPYRFTEGMVTIADRLGNPRTYTAGSLAVTDFDAWGRILDREYATGMMSYRCGLDHMNDLENGMATFLYNTKVDYTSSKPMLDAAGVTKDMAVAVGFSYLTKGSRTYCISRDPMFTNQQTFGITGSDTPTLAVITPMGAQKDPKNGQEVNSFGYVYKGFGAYSRENEIWDVRGAGNGLKVIAQDIASTYIRGEIGFEGFGANQWITVRAN